MVQLTLAAAFMAANTLPQLASAAGLNTAAQAAGLKYFGTAVDNNDLSNSAYVSQLGNNQDFGQLTPANSMKWDAIEPSQNQFSYSGGDQIVSLAQQHSQIMRCHNLVWHNQLPGWVTSGSWTNSTLQAVLKNHITNEAGHYKGKCYAWDVVNEALNDDGTYRNQDPFSQIIGPYFIPLAFQIAASVDPSAKLYYNDYNIEYPGSKSTAAVNLVKMVQSYGAKIDGVGLQSHFIVGQTPSTASQKQNMAAFTALGVEVAITELDIRMTLPSTASLLAQQGVDYASTVNACVQTKGCVGMTLWDWTDKYSWVPGTFSGQGAACPWDSNLQKKPAYTSILNAFNAAATGGTSPPTSTAATTTTTGGSSNPTTSTTSSAPQTTTASTGGTQAQWGQCGGMGYSGPTTCASPYTCHYSNPYYSQCY